MVQKAGPVLSRGARLAVRVVWAGRQKTPDPTRNAQAAGKVTNPGLTCAAWRRPTSARPKHAPPPNHGPGARPETGHRRQPDSRTGRSANEPARGTTRHARSLRARAPDRGFASRHFESCTWSLRVFPWFYRGFSGRSCLRSSRTASRRAVRVLVTHRRESRRRVTPVPDSLASAAGFGALEVPTGLA